jgi:hypothetical protein
VSDGVVATDPAAAARLVADLQSAARLIDGACVADPGGDATFGAAAGALAAIPGTSTRWRASAADVLAALAAGTSIAAAGTV